MMRRRRLMLLHACSNKKQQQETRRKKKISPQDRRGYLLPLRLPALTAASFLPLPLSDRGIIKRRDDGELQTAK
jgi:hypothetical protein